MCWISLRKLLTDPALGMLAGRFDSKLESYLKRLALKLVPIESWLGDWGSTAAQFDEITTAKILARDCR
jgi:hypothetical protein